ncbi:MAG: hypothetical protein J6V00_05270 [Bacteroidaceae bacterium]|nr:hypothetical protein [Bacteroidaceae bacterium]
MTSLLPNTRRPDIIFHSSGRIDISAHIAKQLNIRSGDVIDIMADRGEYYLYVRTRAAIGRHEAQCFVTNNRAKHCHSLRAYSTRLCRAILALTGSNTKASLPCGTPGEQSFGTAIPVITKNKL